MKYYIEVFYFTPFLNCPNFQLLIEIISAMKLESQLRQHIEIYLKRFNLENYINNELGTPLYNFCHYMYVMLIYFCRNEYQPSIYEFTQNAKSILGRLSKDAGPKFCINCKI